jgi:hypothetical protein
VPSASRSRLDIDKPGTYQIAQGEQTGKLAPDWHRHALSGTVAP